MLEELDAALQPSVDPDDAVERIIRLQERIRGDRQAVARLEQALAEQALSRWVRIAVLDVLAHVDDLSRWKARLEDEVNDERDGDGQARVLAVIALRRLECEGNDAAADALWAELPSDLEILAGVARVAGVKRISLVIHGTWASDETWWRRGGDFFNYLSDEVRVPGLYDGAAPFKWSGRNRDEDRREAAVALHEWVRAQGPVESLSVYAHSHGANVAMLATRRGMKIDRLVMMSPPVRNDYFAEWQNVRCAYSIQANRDAVVAIARGGRDFNLAHVAEKVIRANGHSSTHEPQVWRDEKLPAWTGSSLYE